MLNGYIFSFELGQAEQRGDGGFTFFATAAAVGPGGDTPAVAIPKFDP